MGLMQVFRALFGGDRNVVAETVGVFRENAEAGAQRKSAYGQAALAQFGAEFQIERKGWFDRFVDGLNRLPRPVIVISTFVLFLSAMIDPIWFAERMQGLILVPEPLWWLAGTVVAFYFGGRFQIKGHEFRQSIARTAELVPQVIESVSRLRALHAKSPGVADTGTDAELAEAAIQPSDNAAVSAWQEGRK